MGRRKSIIVATVLRPQGETGVQSHLNTAIAFAKQEGVGIELATPFGVNKALVYPVFGLRKLVEPFSSSLGLWWYMRGHRALLQYYLRRRLRLYPHGVIVYAQDLQSAYAAVELRRNGWPIEVVWMVHQNISVADEFAAKGNITEGGWLYKDIVRIERHVLPRVDRLLFPSLFMRDQVTSRTPEIAGVPSYVIPNFIATQDRTPEIQDVSMGDVITIGTLEPRKNQSFILQVLAHAHRLGRPYRLTLVGDGPLRRELETLASRLGLASYVTFAGYVPEAARILPRHKAYAHAARMENLPITVLEALATRKPILAAPSGGIPEVFTDGVEGFFWDLDDPLQAARQLIKLLEDEALYKRMAGAAYARYETCFAPRVVGPQLLEAVLGPRNR